jgi:hypothetical protein
MPVSAADSTLQALFSSLPEMAVNPRAKVVTKLLEAKADPRVRQLVAQEIIQLIETSLDVPSIAPSPLLDQALGWRSRLQPLYTNLMAAVTAYNTAHPGDWLTAREIVERDPTRAGAVRLALEAYEPVLAEVQVWAQTEDTYQGFVEQFIATAHYGIFPRPVRERVYKGQQGVLEALAHLYELDVVLYEPTEDGVLAPVYSARPLGGAGASAALPVNLLLVTEEEEGGQLQPHMDRLEGEREKIQVGQRIIEHHPEEAGEILRKSGIKINAPIGEIMLLIDNVKHLQAMMMENMHAEGVSVEEGVEALENPELQQLTHEIAAITKEIDTKLHDQQIKQAAFKPKPSKASGPGSAAGAASGTAVDPGLYDDITRRAQVDSPLRDLPLGSGSGAAAAALVDQPASYGQAVLERLVDLKEQLGQFIDRHPRMVKAGEVLFTSLAYCAQSAVYIAAGVAGAPGGPAGSAAAMTAVYGTGEAMASAVETGIDKLATVAAAQGRTAEEAARFGQTAEWLARSLAQLVMFRGVAKATSRWSGKGTVAPSAPKKYESEFWKRQDTHEFFGQKNKVYKRDELIDLTKVDLRTGLTNEQRMKRGMAPLGSDNQAINLHHLLQTQEGPPVILILKM